MAKTTKKSATAGKTLKAQNRTVLIGILLINTAVFVLFVTTKVVAFPTVMLMAREWETTCSATVSAVICGVLTELLSAEAKARLVFWRWRNPLPGSEAFSKWGPADPRVDMEAIEKSIGDLPTDAAAQNRAWYKLYSGVQTKPIVEEAQRAFLLNRDYASLAFLMLITFTPIAAFTVRSVGSYSAYTFALLLQYLTVRMAGANTGRRFVATTMAVAAQSLPPDRR